MTNARRGMRSLLSILLISLTGLLWSLSAQAQTPPTITSTNFGMQCGTGKSTNCPNYTLPTTQAQPGLFRLWDSSTYWAILQPVSTKFSSCTDIQKVSGTDTYCWDNLDSWLDAIAASTTIKAVIYTFGGVPCQLVDEVGSTLGGNCGDGPADDPNGLAYPPNDLTSSGSPNFDNFVNNLAQHCSPNENCVGSCPSGETCSTTNLIKYYEMWNEPNGQFWNPGGTEAQLEEMVFPARSYIWTNITGATVMTPGFAFSNSDYETWFQDWLNAENTNGTLSNVVAFHVYMANHSPEAQYLCYIAASTSSAASTCDNSGQESFLYMKDNTTGWATKPWYNTETNFNGSNFTCPLTGTGATDDCAGEIIRWQLLQDSSAASSVAWYYWNTTIGGDTTNEPAYYYMMQYLEGGEFSSTSTCSNPSGTIVTCSFTDANGNSDQWVWTTSTTAQSYAATGYSNYWIVEGSSAGTCAAIPSSGFTVTYDPYLLVNSACTVTP
jgi:hypothetical protein